MWLLLLDMASGSLTLHTEGTAMNLMRKTALMLTALLFAMLGLNFLVLKQTIEPSFAQIEQDQANTNANRVKLAMEREVDHLRSIASDWAFWGDTRKFILERDQAYVDSNLTPASLTSLKVNTLLIYDLRGQLRWGMVLDEDAETQLSVSETFGPTMAWAGNIMHKAEDGSDDIFSGMMQTNKGILLYASAPVLNNDSEGPAVGSLVFGRFLEGATALRIATQTSVPFTLIKPDEVPALNLPITAELSSDYLVVGDKALEVFSPLASRTGMNLAIVNSQTARDISLAGAAALKNAAIALTVGAILVIVLMALALRSMLIIPLQGLTQSVLEVGESDNLLKEIDVSRHDEVGILADKMKTTFRQLYDAREQVRQQSYYTGVLEMSAGLMHNIRNTINPIGIGAWRAKEIIENSRLSKLPIALEKLNSNQLDAAAREKVMTYLHGATKAVKDDHAKLHELLDSVAVEVQTVVNILDAHNAVNRPELMCEQVDIRMVIDQAMKEMPIIDGLQVKIALPDILPQVKGNHLLLRQVVSNLLINSSESISAESPTSGIIEVSIASAENGMLKIMIKDNGEGFAPVDHRRMFQRGFSTRKTKSGGLGLHWCANTVRAMEGELSLDSQGPGSGATATVNLKTNTVSATRAA